MPDTMRAMVKYPRLNFLSRYSLLARFCVRARSRCFPDTCSCIDPIFVPPRVLGAVSDVTCPDSSYFNCLTKRRSSRSTSPHAAHVNPVAVHTVVIEPHSWHPSLRARSLIKKLVSFMFHHAIPMIGTPQLPLYKGTDGIAVGHLRTPG